MYIKQLKLEGFRGFKELTLDFPFVGEGEDRRPVPVVLLGLNGSGKTSVLDAITLSLIEIVNEALDYGEFIGEQKWMVQSKGIQEEDLNIDVTESQIKLITDLGKDMFAILFSSPGITLGMNTKLYGNLAKSYKEYLQGNNSIPVLKFYSTNRNIVPNGGSSISSYFVYGDAFNSGLLNFHAFVDWFDKQVIRENQAKIDQSDFKIEDRDLKNVRNALKNFLSKIPDVNFTNLRFLREQTESKTLFDPESIKPSLAIDKNGETFKFSQLSHGEQMILVVVCDIARRLTLANPKGDALKGKGIVLIDEVELHLHPSWQGIVVNALAETFPNVQFIVTTHSPLVINHVKKESIFILEDFQLKPLEGFNNYGAKVESVLRAVQKVNPNDLVPDDVEVLLQKYFGFIDANELDKAKKVRKELEQKIDPQHPELLKGETLMEMKELLKS